MGQSDRVNPRTVKGWTRLTGLWTWPPEPVLDAGLGHSTPQHYGLLRAHPDTHVPAYPKRLHPQQAQQVFPQACALTCLPASTRQLVSEKVGGAEGTKLDDDFKEMEKVGLLGMVHTGLGRWWLLEDKGAHIWLHLSV